MVFGLFGGHPWSRQSARTFESISESIGESIKFLIDQWFFGYKNILSRSNFVYLSQKQCTQQTLGAIALDCIAYLFAGDECYFMCIIAEIEDNKIVSVPDLAGLFIDLIETFWVCDTIKMLYTANLLRPFARRALITLRPFLVFMRVRKPCVRLRGVLCGWYVLFIMFPWFWALMALNWTQYYLIGA